MTRKIEISYKTIIFIALLIGVFWLIIHILDILLLLFVSFILMSALTPIVDRLEGRKIPRPLAIFIIYIIGIALVGFAGTIIVPPLVSQTIKLGSQLPEFLNSINPAFRINIDTLFQQFIPVSQGIVKLSVGIFTNIISIVTLLVITFYFLLDRNKLDKYFENFFGEVSGTRMFSVVTDIQYRLGAWVRGELALMVIIGLFSFVGLTILRVEFALPLAIFAGILEVIPIIGPLISGIPAVLVGLAVSPGLAIVIAVLYILIHQLENSLIVPSVMRKAVGLPPLVTILSLMVGGRLAGVGGAILAIPFVVILQIIIKDILSHK